LVTFQLFTGMFPYRTESNPSFSLIFGREPSYRKTIGSWDEIKDFDMMSDIDNLIQRTDGRTVGSWDEIGGFDKMSDIDNLTQGSV
jgi:hypothetical protein